jgi:hypothetical protein
VSTKSPVRQSAGFDPSGRSERLAGGLSQGAKNKIKTVWCDGYSKAVINFLR